MKTVFVITSVLCSVSVLSWSAEKPRVFVTDSASWEISGGGGGTTDGFGGAGGGGARPQTAEIIKTFSERCPAVMINNREKADYVVLLDHEGGKEVVSRDNKVVVFNHDGDSIMSRSTRILGNAVKDACTAIAADWPKQTNKMSNAATSGEAKTAAANKK